MVELASYNERLRAGARALDIPLCELWVAERITTATEYAVCH